MIEIPKQAIDATNIYRDMLNIKYNSPYFYNWLQDQLHILDEENRTAEDVDFKQRQGAAQTVAEIIKQIDKSQVEVRRLTGQS